jgi:chromosomal replication initiation ATPase DnaA
MKIYMMSVASLIFLITTVAAAAAVDDDNGNNNTKISNGEQECYSDHFEENMQTIIQRELGTNNNSISDFDIAIKDGQVCVYMNDSLDERKSDISQPAPLQDDNNSNADPDITIRDFLNGNNNDNCNGLSDMCIHQGEGDNEINIEHR